ncbi:hypothetical protein Metme_0050 [Methylomonas methanica MC09]|uniref:Uncharacterized protein n=1 Tax=Methylomonas methanica (strain DSM 25384 / MC09) TaxID=857087 RepID=F9ZX43_METMM|nr:hypothetical protein Metme_0050 [Methylomonas methanica MC09]
MDIIYGPYLIGINLNGVGAKFKKNRTLSDLVFYTIGWCQDDV